MDIKKKKKSEVILNKKDGPAAERGQKVWEDEGLMEGPSPQHGHYSFYCASPTFHFMTYMDIILPCWIKQRGCSRLEDGVIGLSSYPEINQECMQHLSASLGLSGP